MKELIPIINEGDIKAVDGRTLHTFLEVGRDFSNWIKARIEKYEFVENDDYEVLAKSGELDFKGVTKIDYIISLDMAKELAMVENNEKGKQARKYFIEVEKNAKNLHNQLKDLTPAEMTLQVITHLQSQVEEERKAKEEAIRTKAMISDKKVAKALNTASQAVKKVNRLEIELDKSKEYRTIKCMEIICKGYKFDWRKLKAESIKQGLAMVEIFDANYGKLKSYHRDVWNVVYPNFF
jgi:phage anti-repressor protein